MTIRADAHKPEFHRAAPPQLPVRVATTANVTIATALNAGDTVDGVTLAAGDRVLVKDQSTGSQNGIYIAGATPARSFDMSEGVAAWGALVYVIAGTANGGKLFKNTNTSLPTIGSTALTFAEFSAGGSIDVTDGSTTVSPATEVEFDPAAFAVTDQGGGSALVEFVGSGGSGGGTPASARVFNNANIALTSGAVVYLTFNSEEFDSDGFHDTSTNTGRLTIPTGLGGRYLVIGNAETTSLLGANYAVIRKNGSTVVAFGQAYGNDAGSGGLNVSTILDLVVGDYLEFGIRAGAGSKNAVVDLISPMFMLARLSSAASVSVGASVRASANQTVNNGNALFDTEEFDTDGFHSTVTNTDRLTVPAGLGGKYLVWASAGLTTANALDIRFFVNGSQQRIWSQATGSASQLMSIAGVVDLAAGDYVTLNCYTAGSNRTLYGASGGFSSSFGMSRIDSGSTPSGGGFTTVECAAQCFINAAAATTNTPDNGTIGQATGSFAKKNLMQFSLSGVTSVTVAWLQFVVVDFGGTLGQNEGASAWVRSERILRSDVNYAQATWNVYKTGSNWTTAGAAGEGTDYERDNTGYVGPFTSSARIPLMTGAIAQMERIDITGMVQDAIAGGAANLDLLLTTNATSGQNAYTIASRTHGTTRYRPKLVWA